MSKTVLNNYQTLTLRNGYFISEKLQKKISECKLVFIGCGLASNVAIAAARMGFCNFLLVDGDEVDLSNLNRQDFYIEEIGKNKAAVIGKRLGSINPDCHVEVLPRFVKVEDIEDIVKRGDIIINSADFNEVTYAVDELAAKHSKLSISPLNMGFGSVVTVFDHNSQRLEKLTNGVCKSDQDYLLKLYKNLEDFKLPSYIRKHIPKALLFIVKKGFFPQNMIAAQTSSLLILDIIVRHLKGEKLITAPRAVALDVEELYD